MGQKMGKEEGNGRTSDTDDAAGNAARMTEAFIAGKLPISVSVMHSPREM